MEKRVFIYHFINVYLTEVVKETILLENWEGSDFDARYAEYPVIFSKLSSECLRAGISNKEIINSLVRNKKILVSKFNQVISKHFVDKLKESPLKEGVSQEIIKNEIPLGEDEINPYILEVFRDIEERVYND